MTTHRFILPLVVAVAALSCGINQNRAQSLAGMKPPQCDRTAVIERMARKVTSAERKAAAERLKAIRQGKQGGIKTAASPATLNPGGTPDYFGCPNWANSPLPAVDPQTGQISGGIRKFVDSLPGLGADKANNLGQYLPVAVPEPSAFAVLAAALAGLPGLRLIRRKS